MEMVDRIGREVGVIDTAIRDGANGWADYLASQAASPGARTPGAPQTADDFRQRQLLGEERRQATEAVAMAAGTDFGNVAKRDDVDAVLSIARDRAEDRGTTVDHEIGRAAQRREKARKANKQWTVLLTWAAAAAATRPCSPAR